MRAARAVWAEAWRETRLLASEWLLGLAMRADPDPDRKLLIAGLVSLLYKREITIGRLDD